MPRRGSGRYADRIVFLPENLALQQKLCSKITADTPISGLYGLGSCSLDERAPARLGDTASESVLLPALVCAEFVVWLGTELSLISMLTALYFAGPSGLRTASIAMIPLTLAFAASRFTISAHRAIAPGIFPTYGISVLEMDQIAALSAVLDESFSEQSGPALMMSPLRRNSILGSD
ncbi:hypothetical protein B0H19DRAFT_1265470 [Mycena capillaripes]|nr:hypothetical protein B0H19DRAFT_1265470 [Mycena capillaripes]